METELKLTFPAEARAAIERHPVLAEAEARAFAQHAVYYDTADLALRDAGFSLRVRSEGDVFTQTLKHDATAGGAATTRGEWEWQMRDETPDSDLLYNTPAAEFSGKALWPAFEIKVNRVVRRLGLPGDAEVELALDEGQIIAGSARAPISEMELELKSGSPGSLYRLAVRLHDALPLRILTESKAARGYKLKTGRSSRPVKAAKPNLDRRVTGHIGFRCIVANPLGGLTRNQPAAESDDPEGTHQMRVSIRKLRAAFVLFKPLLEPHVTGQFDAVLRRLGHVLGEARDWDVFCRETLPAANAEVAAAGWSNVLADAAGRQRLASYEALREELAGAALTGTVLGIATWVEDETALGDETLRKPLTMSAPALMGRLAEKAAMRGRHLKTPTPQDLHQLRKMLKKLRYAAEFLSGLYAEKSVKHYLKPLKRLQRLLGEVNDAAMAASLAERLCEGEALDRVPALGNIAAWADNRRQDAVAKLPKAWKAFNDAEPFWTTTH